MMTKYLTTTKGRLRLYAFLEGFSLLFLVFIAVPIKYFLDDPKWVKIIGPIHGALFVLFMINALWVGVENNWKFKRAALIFVACFVPFGTFYLDRKILRHL